MQAQTTKRCHWVPQSYLKAFAAQGGKRPKIWRFGKTQGNDAELKAIEKVAVKFHLYAPMGPDGVRNDAVEKKLSKLERWFDHDVWRRLCHDEFDLTWEPVRKILAVIIATTWVRNPIQFETWKRTHRLFVDQLSAYDSLPSHMTIGGVRREVDPSDWPAFSAAGEEDMKAAWNAYVAAAGDIAPRLLQMRYSMLALDQPGFVTSDNPVTITHPSGTFRGIGDPETIISFPISPTRTLMLDNRQGEIDGGYYISETGNPTIENLAVWRNAIEHMFSSRHPDAVLAEFLVEDGEDPEQVRRIFREG
jgi:hypothetical protein